jgi:hypothetical protein
MDWESAAHWHDVAGDPDEAKACRLLVTSARLGDAWRARVTELQADGMSFEDAAAMAREEIYG